jgi:hypothetical protein
MIYNKATYETYNMVKGVVLMLVLIGAYEVDAV